MAGGYVPDSGGPSPSYSFSHLVPIRHWVRDPALRSWPVLLLVALVCVPPIALLLLNNPTEARLHDIAWIFAVYFAVAWLLLLGVIVRPQHVSRSMLAAIAVIGIVTQAPIAIFLETKLHSNTGSLLDVFTIGIPEELAKAIPIVVVAWIWRRYWHTQTPRDYLFLGAVSGLVFGAAEVVHYFIDVLGSLSGNATGPELQALTLEYVWRFLTDPIDHAMWAGITGYFIGLAITGPHRKYSLGFVGIGIAAVLHGLNDWNLVNGHGAWVLVTLASVLLFLGYARAGAWLPEQTMAAAPVLGPAPGMPPPGHAPRAGYAPAAGHAPPAGYAPAAGHAPPAGYAPAAGHAPPAGYAPAVGHAPPAGYAPPPGYPPPSGDWWQRPPAPNTPNSPNIPNTPGQPPSPASPPPARPPAPQPSHAAPVRPQRAARHTATAPTVAQPKSAPKPWWEQ